MEEGEGEGEGEEVRELDQKVVQDQGEVEILLHVRHRHSPEC